MAHTIDKGAKYKFLGENAFFVTLSKEKMQHSYAKNTELRDAAHAIGHRQMQPGSDEDKRARTQLELPMGHGGRGLHRLSPVEFSAVLLSSAALANVAITGAPDQPRPFDGPLAQAFARSGPSSVPM